MGDGRSERTPTRAAPRGRAADASPAGEGRAASAWGWIGAAALLPLLWASRGPTLGMPVADDYIFLAHLRRHALDVFGPMGASFYWRPVGRQLYYLALAPWLARAPWLAAALAALLLLGLYAVVLRLARRRFDPAIAAAIAAFPLLAEPARVLLAWPSAAQHLLGALLAALALERAAAGRMAIAGGAALLALLSNEATVVVLPALPLLGGLRAHPRALRRWLLLAAAVAAIWLGGYALAGSRGAGLPLHAGPVPGPREAWTVLARALTAQLGCEGLPPRTAGVLLGAFGALLACAAALSFRRPARARLAAAAPWLAGGAAWFVAGVLPLAFLLPDWNAWRTTVAGLGLAFALTGWLALAARPLVLALVGLRLGALLLAEAAPGTVASVPPATVSSFSLARIARLQRTVHSARVALLARVPRLPPGAIVRTWNLPGLAEVGFAGSRALQEWYGDSTLVWTAFGGERGWAAPRGALVEFAREQPWPASVVEPEAVRLYLLAVEDLDVGGCPRADSLLAMARRVQGASGSYFFGLISLVEADCAMRRGDFARADSLGRISVRLAGASSGALVILAYAAAARGDQGRAAHALQDCLAIDPGNQRALMLARELGLTADLAPSGP